jgi:putative redox protein
MVPMRSVTVTWDPGAERFSASGTHLDHAIEINAPHLERDASPTGFSPTELLLAGAGACAAWDVIEIMRKRRRPLSGLAVRVDGRQADKQPWAYDLLRLHFTVSGQDLEEEELRRVLRLSLDRYCSVLATIRPAARIEETIEIVDVLAAGGAARDLPV